MSVTNSIIAAAPGLFFGRNGLGATCQPLPCAMEVDAAKVAFESFGEVT